MPPQLRCKSSCNRSNPTPELPLHAVRGTAAPRAGGREVLMQVTRSVSARIRKWLGLLGKRPAKVPYGAGAWSR